MLDNQNPNRNKFDLEERTTNFANIFSAILNKTV